MKHWILQQAQEVLQAFTVPLSCILHLQIIGCEMSRISDPWRTRRSLVHFLFLVEAFDDFIDFTF